MFGSNIFLVLMAMPLDLERSSDDVLCSDNFLFVSK